MAWRERNESQMALLLLELVCAIIIVSMIVFGKGTFQAELGWWIIGVVAVYLMLNYAMRGNDDDDDSQLHRHDHTDC